MVEVGFGSTRATVRVNGARISVLRAVDETYATHRKCKSTNEIVSVVDN